MASTNRALIYTATTFLLSIIIFAAYTQQLYLLAVPFLALFILYLIQHPPYLFYLLLISIPWSVEYSFNDSLGTDLPDEPLMLLTAFAFIIIFIYKSKWIGQQKLHPLFLILLLQLVWIFFTVLTSSNFTISIKYLLAKCWYVFAFSGAALFLFRDKKIMKSSVVALIFSMFVFICIALARQAQSNFAFEKVNNSLQPFFRNHVNYSALLVCIIPLQIAFFRLSTLKKTRLFLIICLLITLAALYFSYSRGAWLALLIGISAYWLLKKKLLFFSFLFSFAICIATFFWLGDDGHYLKFAHKYKTTIFHKNFREHLLATYQMNDVSTAERYYRWIAGVRMLKDGWQTGFGPNTFYANYRSYTVPAFKTWVSKNEEHSTVHNYFLLSAIEQGAIGLLLFLALIGSMFWYAQGIYHRTKEKFWQITVASTASILAMICTVNFLSDLIETDKVGGIFYMCIAVLVIADVKTKRNYKNKL